MKATLDVEHRHNLHSTTKLVVNEKFDQLLQPSYAENSKSFLTTSGQLAIRTWLDKNAYMPGMQLFFSFFISLLFLFIFIYFISFNFTLLYFISGETVLAKMKANNTSVKPTRKINIKVFVIDTTITYNVDLISRTSSLLFLFSLLFFFFYRFITH